MAEVPQDWEMRGKPPSLFRRFNFDRYSETRDFLDKLAVLSEEVGLHPQNINFASNYVNITITVEESSELTEAEFSLAVRINALYAGT